MLTNKTVSLEDATLAANAALAATKPGDGPLAVCVTNENGDPAYLVRQDAERKAYTAAFIGRDTSVYRAQLAHDGRTVADWSDERVTTLSGGWTLRRDGQVIGGIGVAGSGEEDRDERLALAGAEAAARLAVDAWRAQRPPRS